MSTHERSRRLELSAEKTAKALLRDPSIQVCATGFDAHYDWRNHKLHVPAYSLQEGDDPRVLMAFRGLLDHECAHVEYSDCELIEEMLEVWQRRHGGDATDKLMTLTNAFEDPWIERHWAVLMPGSRKYLAGKTDYVIEQTGGAAPCDPDYVPVPRKNSGRYGYRGQNEARPPIGTFMAFTQAICRVGSGHVTIEQCAPAIQKLMTYCRHEIETGWVADSTQEAIDAAEMVWAKLGQLAEEEKQEEEKKKEQEAKSEPSNETEGDNSGGSTGKEKSEGGSSGAGKQSGEGDNSEEGSSSPSGDRSQGEGEGEAATATASGAGYSGEGVEKVDKAATSAIADEMGEVPTDGEVIAGDFINDPARRPYTVHPEALAQDRFVEYDKKERDQGRVVLRRMKEAAGPTVTKLANRLRMAVKSMKQTMWVGALDDGDELDPDATPMIALGASDPNVFRRQFKRLEESTFVCVLVDLSGSMGTNEPTRICPVHGRTKATKAKTCGHMRHTGEKCGETLRYVSANKAGQAAITAMALHESLRLCGIAHTVLGYRTGWSHAVNAHGTPTYWSRYSSSVETHVFVPAPGLSDDGAALPFITGGGANADGESIMNAARYSAEKARKHDRMIMLVVADGLPSGADDPEIEGRHLKDQVERIAEAGIEVYGVGVGIRDSATFSSYYPNVRASGARAATGNVLLDNASGLSDTVLRRLTDLLTQSTGFARTERQKVDVRVSK